MFVMDFQSSLLEPNHYTNRRIEKRSIATQTDEAIMISNDTQTVSAVANQNSRETQYDPDMSNESFETTEDKSIVFISSDEHSYLEPKDSEEMSVDVKSACIVKTCQHSCIKSNMIDHINKEHSNIFEVRIYFLNFIRRVSFYPLKMIIIFRTQH